MKAPEQRTVDVNVESIDTRGRTLHGYAAVYGVESGDLGGFRERIAPGAFAGVLDADVRCLLNHDPNEVLGRTRSGTLRLADDARGLRFECDLPDSPLGANVREAVSRGDIDGASFRFKVGTESWSSDLRTVETVAELQDVTVATYGAYPAASVELRTRPETENTTSAPADQNPTAEEANIMETETATETTTETTTETEENTEQRSEAENTSSNSAGSLQVEQRATSPRRGLAEEFRAAGFPGEVAEIPWASFEDRAVVWSPSISLLHQTDVQGGPLPVDSAYAWPTLQRVPVDSAATSVQVLVHLSEAVATGVVRDINATTNKAEVTSTIDLQTIALRGVAAVESGIPNIVLEQPAINTIIENDLRTAICEGLDGLVADSLAASGFLAPGAGDNPLVSYRKAVTALAAAGFSADTLLLTPQASEAIDVMTTGVSGGAADFVFAAGAFGPDRIFNMRRVVSKAIPSPIVLDAKAFGKLYASPARLSVHEMDFGRTNSSLVRLELSAACGVERQQAAVRIASS